MLVVRHRWRTTAVGDASAPPLQPATLLADQHLLPASCSCSGASAAPAAACNSWSRASWSAASRKRSGAIANDKLHCQRQGPARKEGRPAPGGAPAACPPLDGTPHRLTCANHRARAARVPQHYCTAAHTTHGTASSRAWLWRLAKGRGPHQPGVAESCTCTRQVPTSIPRQVCGRRG
jgi:hypothetical protein